MHFDEIYVTWKIIQLWTTWGLMVAKIKVCRKPTIYIAAATFLALVPSSISSVLILQDPWFLTLLLLAFDRFICEWLEICYDCRWMFNFIKQEQAGILLEKLRTKVMISRICNHQRRKSTQLMHIFLAS